MQQNETQITPQEHARHIASMLENARHECKADIRRVEDARAQALFETVAEVLGGAMKALNDYQKKNEPAWGSPGRSGSSHPRPPTVSDERTDVGAAEPSPGLVDQVPGEKPPVN